METRTTNKPWTLLKRFVEDKGLGASVLKLLCVYSRIKPLSKYIDILGAGASLWEKGLINTEWGNLQIQNGGKQSFGWVRIKNITLNSSKGPETITPQ